MTRRARAIVETLLRIDPMWDLPRTGWLLRGVRPCESIAEHSYGVAFVTMLLVDALREEGEQPVDGERALRMALLHDIGEARTGDVPMPQKTESVARALHALEAEIVEGMVAPTLAERWREAEAGESLEARIVKAADKIQLMAKARAYRAQGRGDLSEFWENDRNFNARGLAIAEEVFALLREPEAASS